MLESIWQSFIYILSEGPWAWIGRWFFYNSYTNEFSWRKFNSFFIFLSVLCAGYYLYTSQVKLAFASLATGFVIYIFTPDYNDDGTESYPTWKFAVIMTIMISLFIGLAVILTKYSA